MAIIYALFSAQPFVRSRLALFCAGLILALSPFSVPWSYWVLTETLASAATLWVFAECLRSLSSGTFRLGPIALGLSAATLMRWDLIWLLIPIAVVAVFLLGLRRATWNLALATLVVSFPFAILAVRAVLVGLPALPSNLDVPKEQIPRGVMMFYRTTAVREDAVFLLWDVWNRRYSKLPTSFDYASVSGKVDRNGLNTAIQALSKVPNGATVPESVDVLFTDLTEDFKRDHRSYWIQLPIMRSFWLWRGEQPGKPYLVLYQWTLLALIVMAIPVFSFNSPEGAFFGGLLGFIVFRTFFLAALAQLETRYLAPFFPVMELAGVLFLSRFIMSRLPTETSRPQHRASGDCEAGYLVEEVSLQNMSRSRAVGLLLAALAQLRSVRFIAVGLVVTAIFFTVFTALLGIGILRWVAVTGAFALAVVAQYLMQGGLTFQRRIHDPRQIVRFIIAVTVGLAISQIVMLSGPKFQIPEIVTSSLVVISVSLWNWVIFNIWVFKGEQWRGDP